MNGIFGNSGANSNGTVPPGGKFSEKGNTFRGTVYPFSCFYVIPVKCFVSHRLTDPLFWKSEKKKFRITCKETSTLVYKHTILSY